MNFVAVLDKLLFFLQKWWKNYEDKKRQTEHDNLEASPADWFESHFDGVSHLPSDDKTQQTNPTDTKN